jgi:hypothetical protein
MAACAKPQGLKDFTAASENNLSIDISSRSVRSFGFQENPIAART